MSRRRSDFALAPLLPLVWLHAGAAFALSLLVDALAWPRVTAARRRPPTQPDAAPRTRNASILVLNWNGLHFLRDLMPSLRVAVERCPGDHEVIVIDNGSDDGSAQWLEQEHAWARVVRVPENRFFIRGNRAGVEVATRDIVAFINNDMRVEPDFLVRLLAHFGPGDLFAVTGQIRMQGARVETGCTRGHLKKGAFRFEQIEPPAAPGPAFWAGGGNSAFDRAKYDAIGGFDDLYDPCYVEDVALSYEAWRRGWRVLFEPRAVVDHAFRGTSERVFGRERVNRIDRRNRELFFHRCVTDLGLRLQHAVFQPWNVWKDARHTGLAVQLGALWRTWPRLLRACRARQRLRVLARRSDRDVVRASGGVLGRE